MDYIEAERIIKGNVYYFNFMHRLQLDYYKKKRIKEIDIRERVGKDSNRLITFYMGEINKGIRVEVHVIRSISLLEELEIGGFIEDKDNKIIFLIDSIEGLNIFFKILENVKYFKKK